MADKTKCTSFIALKRALDKRGFSYNVDVLKRFKKAGAPTKHDEGFYSVEDWVKWLLENKPIAEDSESEASLKRQKLKLQTEMLQIQRDAALGLYITKNDAEKAVAHAAYAAKSLLLAIPSQLAATVVGLTPIQAESEMRAAILRALDNFAVEKWPEPQS